MERESKVTDTESSVEQSITETRTEIISHTELTKFFRKSINRLIEIDPILRDLHKNPTVDEIQSILSLEHGQAIKVIIQNPTRDWKVLVSKEATVHQLKISLKRVVSLYLERKHIHKRISWKYIWKTYYLNFGGENLKDDNKKLSLYGIRNKSILNFSKKLRNKSKVQI